MPDHVQNRSISIDRRIVQIIAVLTLGNLAICLHRSSRVYLFQQSQCLVYYMRVDPSKIAPDFTIDEALCKNKEVQSPLSIIDGVDAFLMMLPALLVLSTYLKLMPIVGLRRLVSINLLCATCAMTLSIFFFSLHQSWTIPAILSASVFDQIGGGDVVRLSLCTTCIAEISPPEKLTKSYNYMTASYMLASVAASTIGSLLLSHHVYLLNFLAILCFVLSILLTISIPGQTGHDDADKIALEDSTTSLLADDRSRSRRRSSSSDRSLKQRKDRKKIKATIMDSWRSSLLSLIKLFASPNPTFTVLFIFLLNGLAMRVEVLLPQYISLTLHWPLATVNAALAVKALVGAVVLLSLPILRASFLEPRLSTLHTDLCIAGISLFAQSVGMISIGFSTPAPLFIIILCIYTSGIGLSDSMTGFGKMTLPAGERAADFFVRQGLINTIAGLIAAPLWSTVFSFCLKSDALPIGFPFWIGGALFGLGLASLTVLKRWADYAPMMQE